MVINGAYFSFWVNIEMTLAWVINSANMFDLDPDSRPENTRIVSQIHKGCWCWKVFVAPLCLGEPKHGPIQRHLAFPQLLSASRLCWSHHDPKTISETRCENLFSAMFILRSCVAVALQNAFQPFSCFCSAIVPAVSSILHLKVPMPCNWFRFSLQSHFEPKNKKQHTWDCSEQVQKHHSKHVAPEAADTLQKNIPNPKSSKQQNLVQNSWGAFPSQLVVRHGVV